MMPKKVIVEMYDTSAQYPGRTFSTEGFDKINSQISGMDVVSYNPLHGEKELGVVIKKSDIGVFVVFFKRLINLIDSRYGLESATPQLCREKSLEIIGKHPIEGEKFEWHEES